MSERSANRGLRASALSLAAVLALSGPDLRAEPAIGHRPAPAPGPVVRPADARATIPGSSARPGSRMSDSEGRAPHAEAASSRPVSTVPRDEPGGGQARAGDWNSDRVRALIRRSIDRRREWTDDPDLRDYQAHARGHIYFLFDLGRGEERTLVKADQLALNLFWQAPGRTRQMIVGRREKKLLPTGIRYHLDHLTVVMDNFGDRIRLGEGSEVRDALHPAAPGALEFYDYRIVDSLTLTLPDRQVRVHRVDVRPRDPDDAGIVGAIYLDRGTGDIVRMEFTFTAAAYLDPQLDYINVRLENALWEGRYWLPHRQSLELRREVQALKFPAGGIIRAEFGIGDYRFNTGVPEGLFRGPSVTYAPKRAREAYEFEAGLYEALDPELAMSPPSLERIREEATRMIAESRLERAGRLQLAVPGASSVLRFRRGEGLYAGFGLRRDLPMGLSVQVLGGRAFGGDRWVADGTLAVSVGSGVDLELNGFADRPEDVAPWPRSSGALGTLAALADGEDYRNPYWSSGGRLTVRWTTDGALLGRVNQWLSVGWERHESAGLEATGILDRSYRPVRRTDEGDLLSVRWGARGRSGGVEAVGRMSWEFLGEHAGGELAGDFDYSRLMGRLEWVRPELARTLTLRLEGRAGWVVDADRLAAQALFPVGGRGTVRGFEFSRFVGDAYWAGTIDLGRDVRFPFVSISGFADVGWAYGSGSAFDRALGVWNSGSAATAGGTPGVIVGVGAGVGLFFDIIRVEVARGLDDGAIWEVVVRTRRQFWDWL